MMQPPGRRNLLMEALAERLRGNRVAEAAGEVRRVMVDENPPVKAVADALRAVGPVLEMADPFGAQALAMPLAFHGSPHVFDKFRMDKVGTGEGAQAYGHGLYFTSEPKVAEQYRRSLSPLEIKGEPHGASTRIDPYNPEQLVRSEISNSIRLRGKSPSEAIESVRTRTKEYLDYLRKYNSYGSSEDAARSLAEKVSEAERKLAHLDTITPEDIKLSGGTIHAVDLPEGLMDWDARIADQPTAIKSALEGVFKKYGVHGEYVENVANDYWQNATGKEFYNWLKEAIRRNGDTMSRGELDWRASNVLGSSGIPGHSYIGDSSGVRNYVMYGDEAIRPVVKKPSLDAMKPIIDLLRESQ